MCQFGSGKMTNSSAIFFRKLSNMRIAFGSLFLSFAAVAVNSQVLPEDVITYSRRAAQLSKMVYRLGEHVDDSDNPGSITVRSTANGADQALWEKYEGVCYVAFRGTGTNILDALQNLDPGTKKLCSKSKGCCTIRQGFASGFIDAEYRFELEGWARKCRTDCPTCPLVVTGHSQGGSIAIAAGIVLADLDPYIITFGQPGTIVKDKANAAACGKVMNFNTRFFRFVNTRFELDKDFGVDMVSQLSPGAAHHGTLILLGDDDTRVKLYADGADSGLGFFQGDPLAHSSSLYNARLTMLQKKLKSKVGFGSGHGCNRNDHCQTGICVQSTCVFEKGITPAASPVATSAKLPIGSSCDDNEDCLTNQCSIGLTLSKKCAQSK